MSRELRVGLDVTGAQRQRVTGWERFALEYWAALESRSADWCTPVRLEGRYQPAGHLRTHLRQLIRYAYGDRQRADAEGVDVLHALTFPPGNTGRPTVWTVHDDLVLGGHSEYARPGAKIWVPLARRALRWTDRIVTDTRSVARDLADLGVPEQKLRVVSPGVPELGDPVRPITRPVRLADAQASELPDAFLLAVGTLEKRKRPDVLAKVADMVGVPLVLVGRTDPSFRPRSWPHGVLRFERLSDGELSWLYRNADVFLALSSYEGLDFPLLEALSVGTAAVASDIPVHRGLTAGQASLVPVQDVRRVAEAVRTATRPRDIELPTWQDCVDGYVSLYGELTG